jgi:5-(carboxyamino)imidazole ribonucleotide synthase
MKPILPGATIGVLGSGQLGRMFAIAARRMGYRVHTYSPDEDTPTGQVADVEWQGPYEDLDRVAQFARGVDVVTFEFENVAAATAATCEGLVPVRPSGRVLETTQQRIREKRFIQNAGLPITPFRIIRSFSDLRPALDDLGFPAVLKTADFGYDGKGQAAIRSAAEIESAWEAVAGSQTSFDAVLEMFIDFECEISVVAARGIDGAFAHFGAVENQHERHILDTTIAPARVATRVASEAVGIARAVLEKLDVIGVLCVEFFVASSGLMINELAPRPHNSGHFSFDACVTSQFEQQLRAVCGLPLGSTEQMRPAVMVNLLGDLWEREKPDWPAALARHNVKLHLYGKRQPRPGRKMGHLTAMADRIEIALQTAQEARKALVRR